MSNKDDYMHLEDILEQDDECYIRFKGDAKMPNYICYTINEFEFDCLIAKSIRDHDWNDDVIYAFGILRKMIFGRVMCEMPDELIGECVSKMTKILNEEEEE